MKRSLAALAAAALALALAPGAALGAIMGDLDQSADVASPPTMYEVAAGEGSAFVTQTFTAGVTGVMTYVVLYCDPGEGSVEVDVMVGTPESHSSDSETCSAAGWLGFMALMPVVAGQQYTIAVGSEEAFGLGVAAANYTGGAAAQDDSPIPGVSDFAFKTYVVELARTTYSWSTANVPAGASTAVTLTTTTVFPEGVRENVAPAVAPESPWVVQLGALPSWFTPTSMQCSPEVWAEDCNLAQYAAGIYVDPSLSQDEDDMIVVITIEGTASPAAADVGATGTASGQGCFNITGPGGDPWNMCDPGLAVLTVGTGLTPPPSVTAGDSAPSSGTLPVWLLAGPLALFGVLAVGHRRWVSRTH